MKIRVLLGVLLLSFSATAACSNSCEELAEKTCIETGENSDECGKARQRAGDVSASIKESCDRALELVESMEKQGN
jgi:hypothetical protein